MGLNGKQLLENFKEDEAYGNTTYTPPANDDDSGTQTGLLDGLLGKVGAAADWVNNNIEYVEKSPVGQWVGNNVEWLESTPVGQALAPSNSVIKNLPVLLGLAINASVTPKDDDTFGGSAYNALANGEANVIGTMADFLHQDDLAASMRALANKTQDDTPVAPGLDWDYISSPHGLTRSTFNAAGSMIPILPSVFLAPEGLVAAAGRISPWLANGARFGMTAIPEAMAEGGQTRREAIEDGLDHPDLRAIGTAAKNLPLLAVSNTLEGAVLGGGLGKALAGKAGESVLARMAKAPLRATPSALVEGLQQGLEEGLQQGIHDSSLDKEHGWLPWNWNDEQWQNAAEGFWGTLPLGAIGGARKAVFPGNVSSGGSAAADSPLDQAQDDIDSITSQTAQQSVIQSAQQDMENNPYTAPTAMQDTSYEAPSDTSSGSSYDASALEGDPQYTISGEVSSTDVTPLTDQKMRLLDSAYYNKYGQHLYITSMKRNGNPDESWHNSGQAFDTADDNLENNKEARDWLISEGEKLGLTPLDEYEHPSAGATGGHIHFSDHGEPIPDGIRVDESDSDMDDSDMDDSTGGVDLSNLPVGDIAMDIAQNTNLPVNFIWSQLSHESDGGKSKLAVEDHNYGGVKGNDGEYLHFDNDQQFIDYMSKYYPKYREDGIYDAKTADQFAEALQHGGYFTADLGEYEGGMHRYLEQAGLSQDAMFGGKARRAGRKGGDSTSSTPDLSGSFEISADDPAMDSMFASFAKDWQNMSTDANEINFFGDMFNSRNKFKATEENKQAILDNYGDAFRQYVQENQPQTVQAAQTTQTPVQPKQTPQPQHIEVHTPNLDSEQAKEAQMHAALAPKIFKPIDLAPFKGNPAGALGYLDELRQVADNFNYNKDYIRSINEQMHKIGTALGVPTDDSAAIYDALNNDQRDSYNYEFMRHRRDTLQAIHDYPIHPQQKQQVGEYIHMLDEEIARLQGKAAQAQAVQQTGAQATPQSTPQAPAQKVHIATATPKQENALASISDGTIAAAKQADDGFSAPLNIFSADEQKALRNAGLVYDDANYNGAERVKVDPLYEEGDRRMKSGKAKVKAETKNAGKVDKYKKDAEKIYLRFKSGKFSADDSVNQLENLKKKATSDKALSDEEKAEVVAEADNQIHRIKPQKETKEHETQKYSSKTAETAQGGKAEGYPHQDAEPEPRKAADTQRKAEESEVSATKKAADKGGRDEQTLSEKEVVLKHISTLFGKPITNKETGIVATFGTKGANKMVSNKAVDKTVKNGYSQHEHLEAVKDIKRLYEDAGLSVQHEDRDKSPNILSIKRFRTNMTTVDGNPATAKITVKETKQNGHKIYSIELEALEKPSELNHARADSSEGQTVRPTKGKQPSSAYADESSSSTHIIPHEQKEGTKNLDSANVPAMGEPIHGIKGTETTVVTDSGKEIRVRYLVVPASRVITSHNAETMTPNKAYPQELQPRDRQRVSMQEQVTSMANELRPADLGAGRNLNQGAPIIRKDGVVLNGNGRAMAIQKATAAGGDKATAYRKYIFERSKEFGLSRVNLAQVRKYMLVREVVDDIDADTMQDIIGSTAGGSRMGASEQAKADAKKIKPRDLDSYVDNEQGDLTTAANQDFVARVLYRIVGKNERNAYTDEHGNVNADGIQRVKRALFSLAYNDDGLIDKMAESTDDNIRNVSRGLMSAAPAFARVNLAVKDGQAYEYDAGKTISDAVKHLDALRREGKPVKDYLNEQSMFSEYQDTDEVREVLRFFDENKRSGKKIGIFLNDMARSILEQGSPNQTSLMDGGRATLGEIIKSAERVAHDGTTAASLFDNAQEAPAEEKPEEATNEKKDESIFGSVEDADKEMLDALGLSEDDLTDDVLTAPSGIKNTAEERERLEKELSAELNKMSAMPMFNPKIYTLGLKLAMTYVKDGINTVKKLVAKLNAKFGDKIGPWAPALAETVRTWPKGVPFDEKNVMAISKAVGARYENGITSLDDMQADMKKLLKGQHDSFAPMIEASYNGIRKFFEAQKGENNHADDSTSGLAERAGRGSDSDAVGADDAGGESGRRSGRGVQEAEGAVRPEGGVRVRDRSAAAGGEAGNRGVQVEESGDRAGSAGSAHVSRSVSDSYEGSVGHDADRTAASIRLTENRRDNASPAGARARDVKPNKSGKRGDLGSIKNDLPMLQPEQQEDVEFIETRVNVNNKPGVMLTNGTGTGKTYSGLGFVKRMYDAGKKNILIVSPSESINDQWIEAANKHFELSIEKLSSTKDSGKDGGICITTYANLQANRELVNRNWDAVVSDESHTLMQNEKGEETGYLSMLRALTMNPRGAYKRFKLQHRTKEIRSLENQIEDLEKKAKAILRPYGDKKKISSADKAKVDALQKEIEGLNKEMEGIFLKMSPGTDKLMQDLKAAYPEEKRPKVLFLSATPFSHDKDIDYAEGYLFHYDEDTGRYGGYNVGTPSDQFMVKHFGYRMRTGKLTRPDAEVDSRAMEVQFHDDLVNSGAMHGRQIAVDKDYDRGFILVDGGIGHKIDEGFKFLSDNHAAYGELYRVLSKQFNKSQQKYLIESIKAREVIPLIREYVKKGKKVVLFHQSMVEHKNIHPFQLKPSADLAENSEVWAQWKAFKSARPDLVDLSLGNIPAPMETLRKELSGHAVFINGNVPKKDRAKNIERFNDDDSGVNIIVCQQDAANAGISLHDTTGKHPRVLINIAMPERPSYAMQIEGRIYRVGNASNAVFRYLSTGTDIEKNMFASTIGGRAASVENLAVGNAARGLRESFRDLYQETMDGSWKRRLPGAEGEGTGGKELDYAATSALSDYDRAKSFYFAQQKRTARTKAQEGNDYFATPEPIGYKMVEWLGLKSGEKALEPSAGHGAISRWFPETTERTIVEPSAQLAPIAQMNTPDAKVVHTRFEDFNIVNKFDGIAMNPPFGTGGKTAVEHLQKAFHHLRDGGRVIAILPEGPAADKRLDKLLDEIIDEVVRVADIHLPAVAFTRAGTKVMTHIVVLDRYTKKAERDAALANIGSYADIDLRHIDGTKELFDRLEGISLPDRTDVKKQAERAKDAESQFTTDTYEHTKTHEMMFKARPRMYLGDSYREVSKLAKEHGGYYSRYADNSFLFKNEEDRDAFVKQADELLGEKGERYSAEEQQEEQARALDELKQEVRDALPGARDIRDDGNRLSFTMPNGAKVEVQLSPSIEVSDTEAGKARAAHGIKPSVRVKINGRERTIGTTALVELSQLGRKGSAYHEAFHAVYDLCLTEKEKAALHRAFDKEAKAQGRDVYEVMADKYRDWMIAKQKGQHTLYGKLWQKVKDAAARLARVVRGADNAGDVFRKVASGEAWERPYNEVESDTRYAAEQKGAQSFIKAAASKLGKRMGVKSDKIITEEAKAKEGIGILDYLIASPSRVATRVKSFRQFYRMGVRAMDVLTERRSYYQRKLGKAMKLVKNKNDYEELTDILLSGDAEGKEWTKEELIQSGTKENVAEAYARIRRLMRQAYKMVNEAHKHPKTYSKRLSDSKIEELRQNPFVKIMKIHDEEDDGRRLVTYREFANYEHTLEGVTKQALDGMRVDEDMQVLEATKQADGTYKVRVREGRGDVTNRKGYIPHFFHNYMVEVRDEDGNYVTTITSGRTQREAVKKAEEWMKDNKLEDGQKIYIHPKIFDFTRYGMSEKGIVQLGDKDFYALMNRVAKDNDMSLEEAKDLLQNVHQKNRHRFFGNVLHRKGVSGFETDMNYVLSHYFNSASRYYAMETEFKPQAISLYERLFGDFAKDSKNSLAQYVKDYINDVNGTPSALERGVNDALMRSKAYRDFVVSHYGERAVLQLSSNIAGATTYMCLGYFNVSSALLNLTQVMNSAAYIGDVSALGKCLSKGMHRKYSLHDLKVLKETNVLNDIGLDSGSGYDVNRMSAKSLLGKINKAGMSFFKVSEQTVRIGTVLTAYESGIKRGMSHEEAIDFAKEVNQKSNFNYSVADAPNIFRRGSFLSQLALQFKKYGIKELEVMADMLSPRTSRKQKLIFWGTYLLAAGLCGLPALDWLDEVLGWVFGKSPKLAAQEAIMEATGGTPVGKFIGRMAMYGLPSSLVGVDLSSRVGMSDVVPTKLKNFLPPLATKIPQFMQDIFSEAKINAVRDFSPAIYNQIAAWGTGKSYDKRGRINAEYNTFYDKLLRSIGFKSTDERVDSDIRRITSERRSELNAEKQKAVDAYIAHPTPQNMQKLKDLGIKDSTVEKERERKKEDSYNRTKGGMTKKEAQENRQLLNFK